MQFWKQIKKTPSGRGKTTIPEGASISMKKPLNISGLRYWSIRESNPWPQQCECCALPTALIPHNGNNGARTHDLPLVRRALSQLSYVSISCN